MTDSSVNEVSQRRQETRPAEHFERFHRWARAHEDPRVVYETLRPLATIASWRYFKVEVRGRHNLPASGPVILAPKHISAWDHFIIASLVARRFRYMAKSKMYVPGMQWFYTRGGVFPVRRGQGDEVALETALILLRRDEIVGVYAEGTRRPIGLGEMKRGVGLLALESGAPVVPVGIHYSWSPKWSRFWQPPRVRVQFLPPERYGLEPNPTWERQMEIVRLIGARIGLATRLAGGII
jgi:1-acyl-sn-glycerol-3-phosphate acyltransferase